MRAVVGPQHVAGMAVAVNPQPPERSGAVERFGHGHEQPIDDGMVTLHQVRRHPVAQQHEVRGFATHALDGNLLAVGKAPERANRVDATDETAEHLPFLVTAQFGPAAPLAGIDGKAMAGVAVQCLAVHLNGRHDGQLALHQLQGKTMLLENALVAPAPRAIELRDHETAVLLAELVDPVLVAVEREEAPVAGETDTFQRVENPVGAEVGVGLLGLGQIRHRFSMGFGAAIIPETGRAVVVGVRPQRAFVFDADRNTSAGPRVGR